MSKFSKDHYLAFANLLREVKPKPEDGRGVIAWGYLRYRISEMFKKDNGRFNEETFMDISDGKGFKSDEVLK